MDQPPLNSVASATWSKMGVTAKQRQASVRATRAAGRIDPLADGYFQGSASGANTNAMNTPRGSGGGMNEEVPQPSPSPTGESNMSAPLLQLHRNKSVSAMWTTQQQQDDLNNTQNKPILEHTTRSARTRQRFGEEALLSDHDQTTTTGLDQTSQVTQVLTGLKASHEQQHLQQQQMMEMQQQQHMLEMQQQQMQLQQQSQPAAGVEMTSMQPQQPHPISPDGPDHESATVTSPPLRTDSKRAFEAPAPAQQTTDTTTVPPQSEPHHYLPPRPISPPLCASCCPCLHVSSHSSSSSFHIHDPNPSCFSSLTTSISSFLGLHAGRTEAEQEMRQGVILPQDVLKINTKEVERVMKQYPEKCVIQLRIRQTDELLADSKIVHPVLRVHFIDLRTGEYWKKEDAQRHVIAPYENLRTDRIKDETTGINGAAATATPATTGHPTILPIMTHPYYLKSHGLFRPEWDENLLINEPLINIHNPFCLILMELLDFGPHLERAESATHPNNQQDGYYRIAWSFLKPLSNQGRSNTGKMCKLQMWRYTNLGELDEEGERRGIWPFNSGSSSSSSLSLFNSSKSNTSNIPSVYYEWIWQRHTGRVKYPSTLLLDLIGTYPPIVEKVRGIRPLLPTQIEEGRLTYEELRETVAPVGDDLLTVDANGEVKVPTKAQRAKLAAQMTPAQRSALIRKRRTGEPNLIPNSFVYEISSGSQGCYVLRYSPDGKIIAAACGDGLMFTLKLYDSDTGTQLHTFLGHHDFIYDINWNCMGTELVSASSDETAKVWMVDVAATRQRSLHQQYNQKVTALHTLQHTGYVYCSSYHPRVSDKQIVFTAGHDGAVRVWNTKSGECMHVMIPEEENQQQHDGTTVVVNSKRAHINSITIAPNGTRIFTGDASGVIRVWEDTNYTKARTKGGAGSNIAAANDDDTSTPWSSRLRLLHTITAPELRDSIITCIRYHPRPERLVAYTRSNSLFVFSLLRYEVRKVLSGVPCQHQNLHCSISPDGEKLVAGGEDGCAYFYSLQTGDLESVMHVGYHTPLYDIQWHPTQHAVAVTSFGGDYPIRMYEYNEAHDLRVLQEQQEAMELSTRISTRTGKLNTMNMMNNSARGPLPPLHVGGTSLPSNQSLAGSARPPLSSSQRFVSAASNAQQQQAMSSRSARSVSGVENDSAATDRLLSASKRVHFTRS